MSDSNSCLMMRQDTEATLRLLSTADRVHCGRPNACIDLAPGITGRTESSSIFPLAYPRAPEGQPPLGHFPPSSTDKTTVHPAPRYLRVPTTSLRRARSTQPRLPPGPTPVDPTPSMRRSWSSASDRRVHCWIRPGTAISSTARKRPASSLSSPLSRRNAVVGAIATQIAAHWHEGTRND